MDGADAENIARIRERLTALETDLEVRSETWNKYGDRLTALERWAWVIIGGATVVAGIGAVLIDAARKHYGL